jgi:para-nitrobenzyl esterase
MKRCRSLDEPVARTRFRLSAGPYHRRSALAVGLAALVAGLITVTAEVSRAAGSPGVELSVGRVLGERETGVTAFRGVPYGEDTRPRRFERALPKAPWSGTLQARSFGPRCPQVAPEGATIDVDGMSEDCLSLNLWTPALDEGRRPVLVYFHGGGYANGTVNEPVYDGAALARRGDVVVVTVNHRLNGFGYLYLGALDSERYADSGNVGQFDLILALRWVQDHIAGFGGDPAKVTVFGQSGGGAKIASLMAMPEAHGLFHRAWTMSGQQITGRLRANAEQTAREVIARMGIPSRAHAEAQLDALRSASMPELMAGLRGGTWTPVVDGRGLPRDPFSPDAPPQSAALSMVLGNTHDETTSLIGRADPSTFDLEWKGVAPALEQHVGAFIGELDPQAIVDHYRQWYPQYSPAQVFFSASTAARSWKGMVIASERRAEQGAPTWIYHLHWRSPYAGGRYGSPHTLDIPLVFGTLDADDWTRGAVESARPVSDALMDALIAFARTGDPNADGRIVWPPFDLQRRATMVFDDSIRVEDDPRGAERALFAPIRYLQPGT